MKKSFLGILSLSVLIVLSACNGFTPSAEPDPQPENETETMMDAEGSSDAMEEESMEMEQEDEGAMSEGGGEQAGITTDEEPMMAEEGQYVAYQDGVIGNGQASVLFFHAGWCPICKAADADLQAWYAANDFPLTVYKVDYDSHADLRQRYGVTYQHTFVKIDGEGNVIEKIQGPSDTQLQALLQ